MQFINITMIPTITSTAVYLVHVTAKTSVLADLFNPDPRWGGRLSPPFYGREMLFLGGSSNISAGREEWGGVASLYILFSPMAK